MTCLMLLRHPRHGHAFSKCHIVAPVPCAVCKGVVWPLLSDCSRCLLCACSAHKGCRDLSQAYCTAVVGVGACTAGDGSGAKPSITENVDPGGTVPTSNAESSCVALEGPQSIAAPADASDMVATGAGAAMVSYYNTPSAILVDTTSLVYNVVDVGGALSSLLTHTKVGYR